MYYFIGVIKDLALKTCIMSVLGVLPQWYNNDRLGEVGWGEFLFLYLNLLKNCPRSFLDICGPLTI